MDPRDIPFATDSPYELHPFTETPQQMHDYQALAADGHGWVVPRPDGRKHGCGGPNVCRTCKLEQMVYSTRSRVMVMDGFNIKPGDQILLIAPPDVSQFQMAEMMAELTKRHPEVGFTVVAGFTGVQIAKSDPSV